MTSPHRPPPGSLITPLEPGSPRGSREVAQRSNRGAQAVHSMAFGGIEAAVASSQGSQHDANEDAHTALGKHERLFVVADGVGGGAMAQMASRHLVAHLHAALGAGQPDAGRVRAAMQDADHAISQRIAQVTESPGAATVALCAPLDASASTWLVAWVGDCRVYRLAMGGAPRIDLLTRDDTFRHLDESPPGGGSLDDPARMVGNGATLGANVALHALARGDLLALCSDGVHKHLDADAWSRLLRQPAPLLQHCEDLIALARANGSSDDATVLLLRRAGFELPGLRWLMRWARSAGTGGTRR